MRTIEYVPAGVPPGGPRLGSTDETVPLPQEQQNAATRIAQPGKRSRKVRRCTTRAIIRLKRTQAPRRLTTVHGLILGVTRNCGQVNIVERCVVITTRVAPAGFVPSKVTVDGATVQEAPVGKPEQLNITT